MADTKLSALTTPSGGLAAADLLYLVDVSDTTDSAAGSSRKTTVADVLLALLATQAEIEAASTLLSIVTPGRMQYHPGVGKGLLKFSIAAGVVTVDASHNVTSVTRNVAGDYSVAWNLDFSTANYSVFALASGVSTRVACDIFGGGLAAGTSRILVYRPSTEVLTEASFVCVGAFGDQ